MRRILIFLSLTIILLTLFQLNRMAGSWHYIVAAEPGELLYVGTFDDSAPDWEQYEGQLSAQSMDGVMRLAVETDGDGIYSAARPYFGDFDVRVESRVTSGVFDGLNNNAYGLLFRQRDRQNYYVFLVSSDGTYRVKRVVDNTSRFVSDWIASPAIRQDIGATNILRVIGIGDQFQFYINDVRVQLCIPDDPDAQSTVFNDECLQGEMRDTLVDGSIPFGRLGVTAELDRNEREPVVVEFDNVIVYAPQSPDELER